MSSGWVSIRHVAGQNASSVWLSSYEGDGHALQRNSRTGMYDDLYTDLAVCLSQEELGCSFTQSGTLGVPPYEVQFNGSVSGTLGEAVTWHWDFGDGTTATGTANPTHVYTTDGHYTVSVTVTTPTRSTTVTAPHGIEVSQFLPALSFRSVCILLTVLAGVGAAVAAFGLRSRSAR
jgi:PKD repeat protein